MLRIIGWMCVGLGLFVAYAFASIAVFAVVLWQHLTGTEPEVYLTGTELDPY